MTASISRAVPRTFVRAIANSSCEGWTSQARCTQTSAPATTLPSSSLEMSARRHDTFATSRSAGRRATATMLSICGSVDSMGIKVGDEVVAIIKSTEVMIQKD